ncbi:unnamed protein product [Linum tenue]|uniref:Hydrophobic seed protein domain-containing protein n=1 Tax=Linum tenue TaxID=586396 RepID=A0AAV0JVF8_9ROSI|nr:unnamed protein product [Linum tenue]
MASSKSSIATLFLAFNLLLFVSSPAAAVLDTCSYDVANLNVCVDLLNFLYVGVGTKPPTQPCCTVVCGVATDVEAAVCVCAALKAGVLGIYANLNLALELLLTQCGKHVPLGYVCA